MNYSENRAKILIIDDESVYIDVLSDLLRSEHRIVAAKTGEAAMERLEKNSLPDLILLDVIMPGRNGYQICEWLKSNPRTRDIPVIFITASSNEEDEAKGFAVGAVDYITKPFRPSIVQARVKTHIELKRRGDMLERLAIIDGLTSIPNRRRFDQFLDYEWSRSLRYGHPFSLLLMDVDFFKLYNDHYGHAEGDCCLRKVAEAISRSLPRTMDLAARYGGEEFACVLPETNLSGGTAVAERILRSVRDLEIPHACSKAAQVVTLSVGIACMTPSTGTRPLDMIGQADQALYLAKFNGRNQMACLEAI